MTVYAIAQITINDRDAYMRYQSRFMDVFARFNGRLLAADEQPKIIEGEWPHQKLILMSFPDEASFRAWSDSPAYREIAKDRKAGAPGVVILAKGLS